MWHDGNDAAAIFDSLKNQEAIELMSTSPRQANVPKIKKTFSTSNKMIVYTSNVCSLSEQTKNLPV